MKNGIDINGNRECNLHDSDRVGKDNSRKDQVIKKFSVDKSEYILQ